MFERKTTDLQFFSFQLLQQQQRKFCVRDFCVQQMFASLCLPCIQLHLSCAHNLRIASNKSTNLCAMLRASKANRTHSCCVGGGSGAPLTHFCARLFSLPQSSFIRSFVCLFVRSFANSFVRLFARRGNSILCGIAAAERDLLLVSILFFRRPLRYFLCAFM